MNKKLTSVAAGLGFAQLALFAISATAQEQPARNLDDVVVTATRSPKKQSEIGKVVRVITSEQLNKSVGRTLPEVLNNVAGLTLSGTGNAMGSNISIFTRGAASGNTLILIDGIPANNASDITNSFDISSFAIDQIERVEILRGVNSTLYGSDAVAGVINIITKQPSAKRLNADVLFSGGTYNTFRESLGLNGTIGTTGVALNFSNTTTDGISVAKDAIGTGNFDKDGFNQQALTGHLKQNLSDKFSVQANWQVSQNQFDLDAGAFTDDTDYTGKNTSVFAGLTAKYSLPKGALNFIANQNYVNNRFFNPTFGTDEFSSQNNKGNISYFEAILNHSIASNLDITAGANYRYLSTDQTFESVSSFGPYNSYLPAKDANNNIVSTYASLFFKAEGFHFELGGRYNHHSDYGNNFTYTINPSYVFADRFKVFASLGSAFKTPSLYQLTSEYRNPNGLDPETTTSYEGGIDFELIPSKVNFSATGFIRNTDDIIYFATDPVTFASQYNNGNKQKDKGFEVELSTTLTEKLTFNAWYAFVKGRSIDENNAEINYLLRRPKNTFGANAGYAISRAVSVNLIYKYTGTRPDSFDYPPVIKDQHAYTILDAYVQVKPVSKLTLFADIKNIFDEKYTEWEGYSTKGTNFNAGLKYSINN